MVAGDGAHHNLLRPEALEAMFVLWRVTAKPKYRDWAWAMFQAFEKHCKARAWINMSWGAGMLTLVLPCNARWNQGNAP